jgi:tetratricopeptide (TPR) repeat protein
LHLISEEVKGSDEFSQHRFMPIKRIYVDNILKWRGVIIFLLFIFLIWFIWVFNLKPLKINSQINLARHLAKNEKCQMAISVMEEILPQKSILDSYLRLKYFETLDRCQRDLKIDLTKKKIEILKEQIKIQPYYTRSWISLGSLTNVLIESENDPQNIEKLKKEANYYFEKANQLSPKRQEVFIEWVITDLLTGEYQKAKEKAKKCIKLNEKLGDCWWQMALSNIYLGEKEMAKENMEIAKERGYPIESKISLLELIRAYTKVGNFEEAKKETLKILELFPESNF